MQANDQMRRGAQIMAAIFGGPGIFYVWASFYNPSDALTAILYLGTATTLALLSEDKSGAPTGATLRRCLALIRPSRRRR